MSGNHETSQDTFRLASWSQRWEGLSIASSLLLCAGLLLGIPEAADASSIASSTISFSNPQITSAGGMVVLQGPWTSQAYANAQNSLGEINNEFTSSTGAASTASASVTWANASGTANVSPLSGTASGNVNIPGTTGQAITASTADLLNTFMITGGTGMVNVTFSTNLNGELQVANDQYGVLATAEAIFALQVDGTPYLFFDSPISVGPSASIVSPFCYGTGSGCSPSLSNSVMLDYNTPCSLYIEIDAETSGYSVTPEPPAAVLLFTALLGIAMFGWAERRLA
jgi:hypothetical protein